MEIRLTGRSAVITGGSSGIGLAVARQYSEAGADWRLLARRLDVLEEARRSIEASATGRVVAVQCDMSSEVQISTAYGQVMQAFGKVDIVVNNSGGGRRASFHEITDELWRVDIVDLSPRSGPH